MKKFILKAFEKELQLKTGLRVSAEVEPSPSGLFYRLKISDPQKVLTLPSDVGTQLGARGQDLWKATCAEIFVSSGGEPYWEFNFAPDGRWDAFEFRTYRQGGRSESPPTLTAGWAVRPGECQLTAEIRGIGPVASFHPTAIVESSSGKLHWAPEHPPGKPDFHLRQYFLDATRD